VFENGVLRRILEPKRDEVTVRSSIICTLHQILLERWAEHLACLVKIINAYKIMFRRPEGKRLLVRPRRRWEDNIKMDLRERGFRDMD
jgi:hypothetical protein